MDLEKKIELIKRPPTKEVITEEELRELLQTKPHPVAYDGFEPSGKAHVAAGLMRAQKIKDLLEAGVKFKLLVADWHGWINNKMGGDLDKLQEVGKYLIKVWETMGVDPEKVEVVWASELVKDPDYWKKVIEVAKHTSVKRMNRATQIMGRAEGELQDTAQYFYPAMQVADIFELGVDITQLGMDQRKANMLAREVGPKLGLWKPVVVSHHMLIGLKGPARMEMDQKMSKSKPDSAIFVHDSLEEIQRKLKKAFCPEKQVEENPLIELCEFVILRGSGDKPLEIKRPEKFGGDVQYSDVGQLKKDFAEGKLHPMDLKKAVAERLADMMAPCREYFEKHPEYLKVFEEAEITR